MWEFLKSDLKISPRYFLYCLGEILIVIEKNENSKKLNYHSTIF